MTKIEWADESWNPITGCSHAGSPGCDNCYARRMAKRLAGRFGYPESPNEFDVTFHPDKLDQPLRWRKPRVVFPCSMSDWLHPDIPHEWQAQMLNIMADVRCEQHTFLLLTKRPENCLELLSWMGEYWPGDNPISLWLESELRLPDNVYLGVSVENQDQMWRVEQLLQIPAAKHWVSFEPLLGPIDCAEYLPPVCPVHQVRHDGRQAPDCLRPERRYLDGMIVGGESGPGARPMHPDWARGIRDQCVEAGVPFTFKQWGGWRSSADAVLGLSQRQPKGKRFAKMEWPGFKPLWFARVGKKAAGRELDGVVWDQWPWDVLEGYE